MDSEIKPTIVYFGTPEFAVPPLEALLAKGFRISLVVTAPDRPVGRAQALQASPVKQKALARSIEVFSPENLKENESRDRLRETSPDLFVVAAYGLILPQSILEIPKHGALNIHPSLLPRHRGASPIEHAILAGDEKTGVSIMLMDAEMDHGPIILQEECAIDPAETQETLTEKLSKLSAKLIIRAVPTWIARAIEAKPQNHAAATYTKLLTRDDGHLVWSKSAKDLLRQIHAFHRWPGAFAFWQRNGARVRLRIEKAEFLDSAETHPLGQVFQTNQNLLVIQTGEGALSISVLQLEGKRSMASQEFIRGNPAIIGSILS